MRNVYEIPKCRFSGEIQRVGTRHPKISRIAAWQHDAVCESSECENLDTEDALEAWIIEHVIPRLESNDWPSPGTVGFVKCMHELKVEIMNADPSVIERRNQISRCGATI